jgi:hypothetical protein
LGCRGGYQNHRLFRKVAAVSGGQFIMMLDEDSFREAQQSFGIREQSVNICTSLDFFIGPFELVSGAELTPVNLGSAG